MIIVIVLLVLIVVAETYFCYTILNDEAKLRLWHDDLRSKYETLQQKYNAMEKHKDISHWLSLLRNPNRDKVEIARTGFEKYVDGIGFAYSEYMSAKMYGDGHIDGRFTTGKSNGINKELHGEPQTKEELEFFFGKSADWLWAYYEFYRDFVKVREHPVSKIQAQKENKQHMNKNPNNEVTALLRRLSKGACIHLSSAIVLQTVKHKGQKCLEISGLEGEYRQEVLYRGGKWIDIDGKEHILVEKNTALLSVMKYLLDKLKVLNIYDTPMREL